MARGRESSDGMSWYPAVGAVVGALVAMVWLTGFIGFIVVAAVAVAGAVLGALVSMATGAGKGEPLPGSGDHGDAPGFGPVTGSGVDAQRTEAGHVSPSA
jgi:hypothetical protein